ncbi:type II CRISPR RNA-guided endonuclease Cas9 [Jeotgalibaca caeni]|uniref:type II CRISPR RNA-guided endonuclease Cas9 n=1 Tax=Jeotgalibaca caeni TaxID=3028623 RepID=UPI00237DF25C|nr:type II CRISPR RNA-guided endonuclease Cas9 [Jeotgalibaca caeni]MDE1549162.1 type II CRISPR RNA-guided endonuclease Cas9 [Jeotgalibaca caeni]
MGYRIGLDVGIASVGYSILRTDTEGNPCRIEFLNSVIFDRAEQPKTGASLAAPRREKRGMRRRNRRKQFRKYRTKRLFLESGLLTEEEMKQSFTAVGERSVYQLRTEALDQLLSNQELFRILYFFAGHRGFKSNRKSELTDKDNGPVITAIKEIKQVLEEKNYRTVGEYFYKDEKYSDHIRNKEYEYLGTAERSLLVDEIRLILEKQQEFGNTALNDSFIRRFIGDENEPGIFNQQRDFDEGPGPESPFAGDQIEKMVGNCTFEPEEKRAPKASYTFQYFDLLSKVNNLRVQEMMGAEYKPLNHEDRLLVIQKAFDKEKVTYKDIKKMLQLNEYARFNLLNYGSVKDAAKTEDANFIHLKPYHDLKKAIGKEDFANLTTSERDEIADILTKYSSDKKRIEKFHERTNLSDAQIDKLLPLTFNKFGNLSFKAMKNIINFLELGEVYSDAATSAGYNFRNNRIDWDYIEENVMNPVVKRAVSKTIKVVDQIIRKYGEPDAISIELARELGRSFDDRRKIKKIQDDNKARNAKIAAQLSELGFPVNGENITRLKLWREQGNLDLYTGIAIPLEEVFTYKYDVDHIVPYSKCFDDTFTNKVLTSAKCNREKGNRLPMEYLGNDVLRVSALESIASTILNRKKRERLLKRKISKEDVSDWKQRNLQDTQYISKLLRSYFEQNITFSENLDRKQRVFVGNGVITSRLRARWGLNKVRDDGDKHHALDATVVACVTPALTRMLTLYSRRQEVKDNPELWKAYNEEEDPDFEKLSVVKRQQYEKLFSKYFPQPWPGFSKELVVRLSDNPKELIKAQGYEEVRKIYSPEEIEALKPIFVVRMPRRKVSGAAHLETIRGAKLLHEGKTLSRVSLDKLKLDKNGEIVSGNAQFYKTADNGWKIVYEALHAELVKHGGDGAKAFPNGDFSYEHNGNEHTVRKVKMVQKSTLQAVLDKGNSAADNGSMVRIDVFKTPKKYVFVPIYVKDTVEAELPKKAVVALKPYSEWMETREEEFLFSLYPRDMVHIQTKSGIKPIFSNGRKPEPHETVYDFIGYFYGADIFTGSIQVVAHDNSYRGRGIGIANLLNLEKYSVDYFGDYHKVTEKKRQTFKGKKGKQNGISQHLHREPSAVEHSQ